MPRRKGPVFTPEFPERPTYEALTRSFEIARRDTGQSRRVANLLLAWHNAEENGGWDPTDLWNVDEAVADDMLTVLRFVKASHVYPDSLGFEEEMHAGARTWAANGRP